MQNPNLKPIYLDYNATTPVRPEVVARMAECLAMPLNASSVHRFGREAKKHLENARKTIADAVSVFPGEIIFTASGTEANATALRGVAGRWVLVSAVEHSSVLSSLRGKAEAIQRAASAAQEVPSSAHGALAGLPRRYAPRNDEIPVAPSGLIDLAALDAMLAGQPPALVSVMLANNETGVIQPIAEVSALCKKHGALLHTDAVQALGKIPVDFGALGADMMTLSAHKCGGPVGAAALIVRQHLPIAPLLSGGGQELGRRAGTENVAAIAGFARAVECFDFAHMQLVRGWLEAMEHELVNSGAVILPPTTNHQPPTKLPNTSCIAMPGVSGEVQLMDFDLKGFAVSAGSACSSGRIEPSHVLAAMGVPENVSKCAIRVSAGWNTREDELILFAQAWKTLYERVGSNNKSS